MNACTVGETVDYDEFVRRELDALLRYATALCGSRHLAEDVVQEVLARATAQWWRIRTAAVPVAYVRRMITNEFVSHHRKWGRLVPQADVGPARVGPDPADLTADQLLLLQELRRLPVRQRAVLVLRYYGGLSDAEIAEELGCTAGTVRGYASRALAGLRIEMSAPTRTGEV